MALFITGASGCLGRRLLQLLDPNKYGPVRRLVHRHTLPDIPGEDIAGDLLQPRTYVKALAQCDTVIHVAALTGKHIPVECFRVNREGTRALVAACERRGLRRFLYVSNIAVKYADLSRYPYAQAKLEAEEIVRASGLRYTILRPAMILGPGAPILAAMERLASLRVMPVFGGGKERVQPIYVDDLASVIASIVEDDDFDGTTIEVGGPEVLTVEELLVRIRVARRGKRGRVVHLPLRIAERAIAAGAFRPLLPVTPWQLTVLTSEAMADRRCADGKSVDESLQLSADGEIPAQLRRECVALARYLTGKDPSSSVLRDYEESHRPTSDSGHRVPSRFDRTLVLAALRSPFWTRLATAYASRFCRGSVFQDKVALLLGIFEPSELPAPGRAASVGRALALVMSILLFAPAHLALSLLPAKTKKGRAEARPDGTAADRGSV